MPYLIDGANVMAQTRGWRNDLGAARRNLIKDLAVFIAVSRAKVTVVFDGPSDADFPEGATYKSVRIFYARPGGDADTRIMNMVRRSSFNRDTIVVTSDKPLGSFVQRHGAKVVSSGAFRKTLSEAKEQKMEQDRRQELNSVDVDEWMDFFNSRKIDR
jgi:predicted RNA-binding protein with PIN domain